MTSAVAVADTHTARDLIRRAGLRATVPRVAVFNALTRYPHSGAEALFAIVRADLPGTSVQSVYNVLTDLTHAGILRRIEPAGSVALYECRTGDNHHHLICTACGRIHDIECATALAPCLEPAHDHGFRVNEAEVTFWGLCPACTKKRALHKNRDGGYANR